MNREETICILPELSVELAEKCGVKSLSLFGSVCRDEAEPSFPKEDKIYPLALP